MDGIMMTIEGKRGRFKVFSGPELTGEAIMEWIRKNKEEAERERAEQKPSG